MADRYVEYDEREAAPEGVLWLEPETKGKLGSKKREVWNRKHGLLVETKTRQLLVKKKVLIKVTKASKPVIENKGNKENKENSLDCRKKLSDEDVVDIRRGKKSGKTLRVLASKYGVGVAQISRIVRGEQRK